MLGFTPAEPDYDAFLLRLQHTTLALCEDDVPCAADPGTRVFVVLCAFSVVFVFEFGLIFWVVKLHVG